MHDVLKLTGFDPPELISSFCNLEDEWFAGFIRELLVETGSENIKTTPELVVKARLLVKNSVKRAIGRSQTPLQRRIDKLKSVSAEPTPSCVETEVREMNMLCFSNSREGRAARESLRPGVVRSQISDSPAPAWVFEGPRIAPRITPPAPVCSARAVTSEPDFVSFDTAILFYADSRTLQTRFRTIRGRAEISEFAKLAFSKMCKRPATVLNVCRLIREYYDFAFTCEQVAPYWRRCDHLYGAMARAIAFSGRDSPRDWAIRVTVVWGSARN